MFGPINGTPYDLCFSIFGIPVRVHPMFWVIGAFLGGITSDWIQPYAARHNTNVMVVILIWLLCMFLSILVHELGHALLAKKYGWPPMIMLYHIGGMAIFQPTWGYTRERAIKIALAGPAAGLALWGLTLGVVYVVATNQAAIDRNTFLLIKIALEDLSWINFFWSLLNLLPILPLDGGRVSEQLWDKYGGRHAADGCVKMGIAVAILAAVYLGQAGSMFGAIMFGYLAYQNYASLQRRQNPW